MSIFYKSSLTFLSSSSGKSLFSNMKSESIFSQGGGTKTTKISIWKFFVRCGVVYTSTSTG